MEGSRKCDVCITDVYRAPFAKHIISRKQLENIRQDEKNIPDWLFIESF